MPIIQDSGGEITGVQEKTLYSSWHAACNILGIEKDRHRPIMEAQTPGESHGSRSLAQWLEVQRDLAQVTGLTFLVADPKEGYRPQLAEESPLCHTLQDRPGGVELCKQDCGRAVLQASQRNEIVFYRCYGHLNNVAIPVRFTQEGQEKKMIILGGRSFFSYSDFSSYRDRIREMGGDPYKLLELSKSLIFKEKQYLEMTARFVGRLAGSVLSQMVGIDQLRSKVSRLMTLCHISQDVCTQIESPGIYQTILSAIGIMYDSKTVLLLIRQKGTEIFKVVEAFGQDREVFKGVEFHGEDNLIRRAISENCVIKSTDGYDIMKAGLPKDSLSVGLFPIGRGDRVEGLLLLLNSPLTAEEESEITSFCSQISLAVENRHLQEEQRDKTDYLRRLSDVMHTIATSTNSEEVYSVILEQAAWITGAGQGSLMILNEETLELEVKATRGISRSILQHLRVKAGEGIAGTVLQTGTPMVVGNIEQDPRVMKINRPRYRSKSFISIPLKIHDKVIGILNLSDKEGEDLFRDDEIESLSAMMHYASMAIERFHYYKSSLDLRRISITDTLSGLLNRRYFEERLAEEIERSRRYGEPFSLIILDIDDFKRFNDTYGHLVGDEALRNTSLGIRRCIRTIDIAARYGGEEFAVILPQAENADARAIGERIRQEIELGGIKIPGEEQRALLTVSIGIASYPADSSTQEQEELIRHADRALYQAKALGKNRVVLFTEM